MIKLDILSDPICPWCYIGKTNLDRALEQRPDHPFAITWHPFQLNPDMPAGGMDRRDYLEAKFGGKEGAVQAYLPVAERAEAAGLTLNLDAITRTPNTLDAHRLIHWAGIEGAQTPVVSMLFRAYFKDGRDIGDAEVLADIADSAGMDAALVTRLQSLPGVGAGRLVCRLVDGYSTIGGGSAPQSRLETCLIALTPTAHTASALETRLRTGPVPVVARIQHDTVLLDLSEMAAVGPAE